MRDYLLGLATLPGIALAVALLWGAVLLVARLVRAIVRWTPPQPRDTARVAAVVAVARRVWLLRFGMDIAIVIGSRRREEIGDLHARVLHAIDATTTPATEVEP